MCGWRWELCFGLLLGLVGLCHLNSWERGNGHVLDFPWFGLRGVGVAQHQREVWYVHGRRATFRQLSLSPVATWTFGASNQRRYIYIYISNHPSPWKSRHDRPPRVPSGARTHDGRLYNGANTTLPRSIFICGIDPNAFAWPRFHLCRHVLWGGPEPRRAVERWCAGARVQAKISRSLMNPALAFNACGGSIAVYWATTGGLESMGCLAVLMFCWGLYRRA